MDNFNLIKYLKEGRIHKNQKFENLIDEGWKDIFKKKQNVSNEPEQDPGIFKQQALKILKDALKDPQTKSTDIGDWVDDRLMDLYGKNWNVLGPDVEGERISSPDFEKAQEIIDKWEDAEKLDDKNNILSIKKELYNFLQKAIIDF